jgi:hypothetical protein
VPRGADGAALLLPPPLQKREALLVVWPQVWYISAESSTLARLEFFSTARISKLTKNI